jgi:hypothetical protein
VVSPSSARLVGDCIPSTAASSNPPFVRTHYRSLAKKDFFSANEIHSLVLGYDLQHYLRIAMFLFIGVESNR